MQDALAELRSELTGLAAERHGDPARGLARVEGLLTSAPNDPEIIGSLHFLRALLLKELSRFGEAKDQFNQAISWAIDHQLTDIEARSRANLALLLADQGATNEADQQMALADKIAPESARGLVTYLAAVLQQRRGHHHDALANYDKALPLLRSVGDSVTIEVLRLNRGVSLIYLDDIEGARQELLEAEAAAERLGLTILAAMVAHNLCFLEGRRGFLADALAALDRAEVRYRALSWRPKQLPILHSDRTELLLQAGLGTDARLSVAKAIEELEADGVVTDLIEARLLLARTCLATGDYHEAKEVALQVAREFRSARRFGWVTQAAYVARQVDYYLGPNRVLPSLVVSRRFEYLADKLTQQGWPVEGRDALVFGALAALDVDQTDRAQTMLARAARMPGDGAIQHRARLNLAQARLAHQTGEPKKATAVIRRGLKDAAQVLSVTGSTEARLEALQFAGELAALGTAIARQRGSIPLLRAVEQQRSLATAMTPTGSLSSGLDDVLGGLRTGGTEPPSSAIELNVREQSLRAQGEQSPWRKPLSWQALRSATTNRSLVYFLESDGTVSAIVVRGRTTRVVELGAKTTIVDQATFVQFAVQRLSALGSTGGRALVGLHREVGRLHRLLIEPLELAPGPVVVVPCEAVKDVLWSLLSLEGRDFSVAPSGTDWIQTVARPEGSIRQPVLVSGPRLEASDDEVTQIAKLHPDSIMLTGADATVSNVLESFATADLIHIAAHGVFRSESPMFSRIELVDGPITIYDLERLPRMPALIVLSACEIAASRLYPSGGALGTATALTALGARTVVAPLQPIADSTARNHMISFHRHLSNGASPAHALRLCHHRCPNRRRPRTHRHRRDVHSHRRRLTATGAD